MKKKLLAEGVGTMVLVLMGCGAAVMNGGATSVAATLTIAFAFGFIGRGHGLCHRFRIGLPYQSGHYVGRMALWPYERLGSRSLHERTGCRSYYRFGDYLAPRAWRRPSARATATGANSYAAGNLLPALIAEMAFSFIFVFVALCATDPQHGAGNLAGLAIGLTLVLVHIVCIPITGTSVNGPFDRSGSF